ncbi:hypothetical protein CTI12_AA115800 [Artemisia annua]|uniref:Uncharacterized protein n=1 Tax=Artemisia annua TaxID=35608 RepID=A0A2U1PTC9_ARTAN|nr:hypothetical protein CTI12_AA115800 [Artemisia annua]
MLNNWLTNYLANQSQMTSHDHSSFTICDKIVSEMLNISLRYPRKTLFAPDSSLTTEDADELWSYCLETADAQEKNDKYVQPMVWIGVYIAVASLVCILAMAADLFHGFRNKKFWFPNKYFVLNGASITVIAVAMKLPVDLNSAMPSKMDQAAKLGSLAFMCTMMANFMPSLASMDNMTLLANIIGLSILVITMIVNICIQINTSVVDNMFFDFPDFNCIMVAYIYVAMVIMLLLIIICLSLTIPTSKAILEFKYQATDKPSLSDQQTQMSMVEKLREHVRRYWVMAETGNPQFVMVTNPLSTASGGICVFVLVMNMLVVFGLPFGVEDEQQAFTSAYKRSILFIIITQSIGVVVGTIAPIFRCFSVLSFNLVAKWDKKHLMVFKVEKYWTQKLYEWKQSHITFLSGSRRSRTLLYNLRNTILSLCIRFQKLIVVSCKVIWLITIVILRLAVYCLYSWKSVKARLFTPSMASASDDTNEDLSKYVLQVDDEMELAKKTPKGISKSMNSFISNAEKEQNKDLLELLNKSTGFKRVEYFDTDHIQPLLSVELVNSWSLPIVTLTCIAVALPNIHKDKLESFLRSIGEGISYSHLVEESLNNSSEYVNIRKTTMTLWHEVECNYTWLENALSKNAFERKTATEILQWFADKAEEIVIEINKSSNAKMVENPPKMLIAANSMYRITQTILLRDQSNTEPLSKKQLFALLNGMIADILSACFTNLPRVIAMKCQESVIEKREASVKVAARLLGKTTKIIERLEKLELPSMDPDKMAYINEWRIYLKQSIP